MGFRYDMQNKSAQQQAIVRQRDREEQRKKEEAEKQKKEEKSSIKYEFDCDDIKSKLSKEKYEYFIDELERHKEIIIEVLLNEEKRGNDTLYSAIAVKDVPDIEFRRRISEGFNFTRIGNVIKVYKVI